MRLHHAITAIPGDSTIPSAVRIVRRRGFALLAPIRLNDSVAAARRQRAAAAAGIVRSIVDAVVTRFQMAGVAVDDAVSTVGTPLAHIRAYAVAVSRGWIAIGRPVVALLAVFELDLCVSATRWQLATRRAGVGARGGITVTVRTVVALFMGELHNAIAAAWT